MNPHSDTDAAEGPASRATASSLLRQAQSDMELLTAKVPAELPELSEIFACAAESFGRASERFAKTA
jgi:hypothetical protein